MSEEPPYGVIRELLASGNVVPFLGAGASIGRREEGTKWEGPTPNCLPTSAELADFLAEQARFPSHEKYERTDLAKVSAYYEDVSSRESLLLQLRKILNYTFPVGEIHRFLAAVPANQVIVVTNYDTLIEQAFQEAGRPYDLVVYPTDRNDFKNAVMWCPHGSRRPRFVAPNSLAIDLSKTSIIYKMHGTVTPDNAQLDSFVVTEDDYVDFLSRMSSAVPKMLMKHFRTRSFLFLGYSLRDWNLRVVLNNVSRHLANRDKKDRKSWAIQVNPSELERLLWENRHVKIYDVDLQAFVRELKGQAARS
jgi:hypothetical protein